METMPTLKMRTPCADKNDALGWTSGLAVTRHGVSVGLRSNTPEGLQRLHDLLPEGCDTCEESQVDVLFSLKVGGETKRRGVRNFHMLYDGWTSVARSHDLQEALDAFTQAFPDRVAMMSPRILVQARWLELGGRTVLVSGGAAASAGDALVKNGAVMVTQDLVPLDEQAAPAMALILEPGRGKSFRPKTLSPGQAALALLQRAPAFRFRPEQVLTTLSRVAQDTTTFQGRYLDADQVAAFVERRLARL